VSISFAKATSESSSDSSPFAGVAFVRFLTILGVDFVFETFASADLAALGAAAICQRRTCEKHTFRLHIGVFGLWKKISDRRCRKSRVNT
jgi:hypothetical protein